ncbi:MAG: type IV toxin-antitoxin system AbiEi family antitoxin domain-containing protein [Deferrisomatales bacterium]
MSGTAGLGKTERENLARVLRATKGTITVGDVARALSVSRVAASKMISRWARKGWVSRARRGLYLPVPLEARTADVPLEDPWVVAERLFTPCYLGGWTAAEHWGLTEQIFATIVVMTTRRPRDRSPEIKGIRFAVHTIPEEALFGLKAAWRGQIKVRVSDPSRTVVDMLSDPAVGGGVRHVADVFRTYLASEDRSLELLLDYAQRLGNGAVFKRLGFLLERFAPEEEEALHTCRRSLTQGTAKLDPLLSNERLATRWRLWVPESWKQEAGRG